MEGSRSQGVGTRTLRGMSWAYGSYTGGRVLTLVATAILARLLSPKDFGLVALALVFMYLLETLSDLGVSQALVIVEEGEELDRAQTAWVWTAGFGALLTLLTAALAPLAALFFHQHALLTLLPALGLRFFIRSLGATHYALAQKRLDFKARTIAELSDVIVRGVTGITLAIVGLGAWSLVIGYLAGSVALTIMLWIVVPFRPKLKPKRDHLGEMLKFGGTLTAVDILAAIQGNTDYIFIGRVLGATPLGLYTLAFRLPELLIGNLSVVAGRVLFPAFAAIERVRLAHAYLLSLRYTLMFSLPLTVGLAVLADPFIVGVFGDKWASAAPAMRVLTLYSLAVTVGIPAGTVYKATGRAGILFVLGVPRTILLIATVGVFVDNGIVAVAGSMAGVTAVFATIGLALATRLLDVRPRQIWKVAWAPLLATAGMAAVLVPVEHAIDSPWPTLLAGGFAAGVTYLGLLWLFARDAIVRLRDTAFPRFKGVSGPRPG